MRLFFDTNALFKLYHVEAVSEALPAGRQG